VSRLVYVSDAEPGYTRKRKGGGFTYLDAKRKSLTGAVNHRIDKLAIPPAWKNVWISPSPRGHIQATGRDERGRKQYIYHRDWVAAQDAAKFDELIAFGTRLPAIRRRVARDLKKPGLGRERVLAAVVQLLDRTLIRVGNERYAQGNRSYGLTTLRDRHLRARHGDIRFIFTGKGGKTHDVSLHDPRLARILRNCQHLPGQQLFQWLNGDGTRHAVRSDDVNAYLREIADAPFTAKDFRTWGATVQAACELRALGCVPSKVASRRNVNAAVRRVAAALRNTMAVCKRSYIHPAVLAGYGDGSMEKRLNGASERAVLTFLKRCARASRPRP
jgi:DNA topoisomerase-1